MIRLVLHVLKLAIFATIVLVIGQIRISGQRIHDHVRDVVEHAMVQKPVHWVGDTFNFLEGHGAVHANPGRDDRETSAENPEHTDSDRGRLSGLLKKSRR